MWRLKNKGGIQMDKQVLLAVGEAVVAGIAYGVLLYKQKGKEAVMQEAIKAEATIRGRGLGAMKKKAVQEFVAKLPAHVRIFINETTIEAVVKELQPVFEKMKRNI